jgi:hypothetical protein
MLICSISDVHPQKGNELLPAFFGAIDTSSWKVNPFMPVLRIRFEFLSYYVTALFFQFLGRLSTQRSLYVLAC